MIQPHFEVEELTPSQLLRRRLMKYLAIGVAALLLVLMLVFYITYRSNTKILLKKLPEAEEKIFFAIRSFERSVHDVNEERRVTEIKIANINFNCKGGQHELDQSDAELEGAIENFEEKVH